ncbi:hypothetical protein [Gimesia panareensis]|nr:hypothetical protein [Gimesia panareensis]
MIPDSTSLRGAFLYHLLVTGHQSERWLGELWRGAAAVILGGVKRRV